MLLVTGTQFATLVDATLPASITNIHNDFISIISLKVLRNYYVMISEPRG